MKYQFTMLADLIWWANKRTVIKVKSWRDRSINLHWYSLYTNFPMFPKYISRERGKESKKVNAI